VKVGSGVDEAFLTLVVVDIIGKTNILEVKQLEGGFPLLEGRGELLEQIIFPKCCFFQKLYIFKA
jgi:hypothetical protein